ncbi:tRNA (N(6)-L-threonylcarbamoyladenosine(37)-C(2))-methylthiotransferase MtaB [Desulfobacterales bacterium HSG17]|nr:tRNA (N(6)-L-threonylcarbamoyladenosine(37)-C(2))-methylthiotransferase MtaB [Desulfobacterales bacterium HSG17]
MQYKYSIITLGCKVNQCESESISQYLNDAGWQPVQKQEYADLCILNTCTVTHKASMQSRQAARQAIRANPGAKLIVTGCYAQTEPEELQKIEGIDHIIGHNDKHRIPELAVSLIKDKTDLPYVINEKIRNEKLFQQIPGLSVGNRTRPFLKIQDGCNAFCTYCIVPYARGRSRSMPVKSVLNNITLLKKSGYRETVISGIHLGCYGKDLEPETDLPEIDLYGLFKNIDNHKLIDRVRISSIEPHELTDDIIKLIADSDIFCRHFHIPLQSGDNSILKKMYRPYTAEYFNNLILKIHDLMPDAALGADTLIGFPGETDKNFENTYNIIKDLPISYIHVFPFSPRKGTPAYSFPDQVKNEIVKHRCRKMRELGKNKKISFYEKFINQSVDVLVEGNQDKETGMLKGVSSNYLMVRFLGKDDLKNRIIPVRIDKIKEDVSAHGSLPEMLLGAYIKKL